MSEGKYRFLVEDKKGWRIENVPKGGVQNWIIGNPKAILLRFAVVSRTGAGIMPCDTKEEAVQKAQETGDIVQVIKPNQTIFANLPQNAIDLIYQC
jgi:hypothetical protein